MGRSPCYSKEGLNKGAWTAHEDKILREFIRLHGEGKWRHVPKRAGLKRCGKSCRLRWLNYLRPDIKRGNITWDEEDLIIRLHKLLGNRWSLIAGRLPGRTDNEIKNYWNIHLGKKVKDGSQVNTISTLSLSAQSNAKSSTENPKPQLTPKDKITASHFPINLDTQVVHAEANNYKCSTVLIKNSLPHSSMQLQHKFKADDAVSNYSLSDQMETCDNNGFLSFISEEEKELSTYLLKDFMVGDICSSDLLNSDFSNSCDFSYSDSKNEDLLSPCSDQLLVFSDEIFKDWTQSGLAGETNLSNRE